MIDYKIINLGDVFDQFWANANDKDFDNQLMLWDQLVEGPQQKFYDSLVYSKSHDIKWQEKKEKRLQHLFNNLRTTYPETKRLFNDFNIIVKNQIARFREHFSDAHFDNEIYVVPGATFNGRSGNISGVDKAVLAFGADIIVQLNGNLDVLFSHEVFHLYHQNKLGFTEQDYLEKGKLTLPLWTEGLATYVSFILNPNASMGDVLMSEELAIIKKQDLSVLALEFLKVSHEKSFDPLKPMIYQSWFSYGGKINDKFPTRVGYLLGFYIVRHLSSVHQIQEMVTWDIARSHRMVLQALEDLCK
jgi:hypothetical protein